VANPPWRSTASTPRAAAAGLDDQVVLDPQMFLLEDVNQMALNTMVVADAVNQAELLWLCPLCGRAWPRFMSGDRGAMARASSDRINRTLRAAP